jgi:hypothetical protein
MFLWIIAVILLALWTLGLATNYTAYGLVHLLLALAIMVMLAQVFQRPRPLPRQGTEKRKT